jgi:hypothetical protein
MSSTGNSKFSRQTSEVEALKAIYGENFVPLEHAWKTKDPPPHFAIRLIHSDMTLDLEFTMNASYPDLPPEIAIKYKRNISSQLASDILKIAGEAASCRLGIEMVYEIVELVREKLSDPHSKISFYDQMIQRQQKEELGKQDKIQKEEHKIVTQFEAKIKKEI